jgi:hypothetical protein
MALQSAPQPGAGSSGGSRADSAALRLHAAGDPHRPGVETFIRGVYAQRYGASVPAFMPLLVSLAAPDGEILAAAGYRSAATGALFLEHYLREPVEDEFAWHAGRALARREIVEIGHLAAASAGAGRRLVLLLGPHLAQQRFGWAVATLTRELRQMLTRMGVASLALAPADPLVLGDDAVHWGSYYEHQPVVVAGEVLSALRRFAQRSAQPTEPHA